MEIARTTKQYKPKKEFSLTAQAAFTLYKAHLKKLSKREEQAEKKYREALELSINITNLFDSFSIKELELFLSVVEDKEPKKRLAKIKNKKIRAIFENVEKAEKSNALLPLFFILNELSLSSKPSLKLIRKKDVLNQLSSLAKAYKSAKTLRIKKYTSSILSKLLTKRFLELRELFSSAKDYIFFYLFTHILPLILQAGMDEEEIEVLASHIRKLLSLPTPVALFYLKQIRKFLFYFGGGKKMLGMFLKALLKG